MGMQDGGCVILEKTIKHKPKKGDEESIVLRIESPVISSSDSMVDSSNEVEDEEICIDQTYREALAAEPDQAIQVTHLKTSIGIAEHILHRMNFQKSVVRVQRNAVYMERRVPVVCLCEEMVESIGAAYGDRIIVESAAGPKVKKIAARCAPLTSLMQKFHDYVSSPTGDACVQARLKRETGDYFTYPSDWEISSDVLKNRGDSIHPIFMDQLARKDLGDVEPIPDLYPVKIRRSLKWEFLKKLNRLGSIGLLAVPIVAIGLTAEPKDWTDYLRWILFIGFAAWAIWSLLASSTYKTISSE